MISLQFSDALSEKKQLKQLLSPARVKRWILHATASPHPADQITLRIVDSEEARQINCHFRGKKKNYASNVLTFDYQHSPHIEADLVLCAPVITQEACDQGKALQAHWAHMIIHGILHAQGYDHESNQSDALEMEALEVLLMQSLGYPNPY